jgi:transposase-like protein
MANDGKGGKVTPWPAEVKERALALAADHGVGRAARELNLSENTIKSWQKRQAARAHKELTRQGLVMPVRRNVPWASRRAELLAGLASLSEEAVAAARLAVSEGRSKAASDFSSVASRSLDKAALLGGDVTSRSESRSLSVRVDADEVQKLNDEIRELEEELSGE